MKKLILGLLCMFLLLTAACAENTKLVNCDELGIVLSIPENCTTKYSSSARGLYVYAEEEGAIPYVLIVPRTESMRFKDPEGYLNQGYKDYMIKTYGKGQTEMSPAKSYEFGGKTMLGARYGYTVDGHPLEQLKLIEIGTDSDIEYTVKYLKGEDKAVLSLMDAVAFSLQTDNGDRLMSSGTEIREPLPSSTSVLQPDEPGAADTQNGTFRAEVTDLDRLDNGGYFTLRLYQNATYPAERVEALQAGDRVEVKGTVYTVKSMVRHEPNVIELIPEEEIYGYIVFNGKNGRYTVMVDDETVTAFVSEVKVWMPLANDFAFAWVEASDEATVYDADSFASLIRRGKMAELTPGHTTVQFQDGLLIAILYTDFTE